MDNNDHNHGWIGVDLDGTLAEYDEWQGPLHIGIPVPSMVNRVNAWLQAGIEVRLFTARWCDESNRPIFRNTFHEWALAAGIIYPLQITNVKDYAMIELWDDRAVQVVPNKGLRVDQLGPSGGIRH